MINAKTFLILIQVILVSSVSGQTLVKENRLWSNTLIGTESGSQYQSWWIRFNGDSVVSDTTYSIIYRSDSESHENWYKYGLIREDSSNKVFLRKNNYDYLLYDFNLEVGDSIRWPYGGYCHVAIVDSITLDFWENPLKRIHFYLYGSSGYIWPYPWIEGIGSTQGILSGVEYIGIVGGAYALVCYSENEVLKYHEYFNTCFPQGFLESIESNIDELSSVNVRYGPDILLFEFENIDTQNAKIWIYNISGKIVGSYDIRGVRILEISKSDFDSGLYIFRFMNNNKLIEGKFIIN